MRTLRHPMLCLLCAAAFARGEDRKSDARYFCINLHDKANSYVAEQFSGDEQGEGKLKPGEYTFQGVKFKIAAMYLQLGSTVQEGPARIAGIKVDRAFSRLHMLHATGWSTADDTIIGKYVVTWDDDTTATIPIRYGVDCLDWWYDENTPKPERAKVAWEGASKQSAAKGMKIRLYVASWKNPKPEKKVKTIAFTTNKETSCAPFCVALTAEMR
jgi:hypothetical protein